MLWEKFNIFWLNKYKTERKIDTPLSKCITYTSQGDFVNELCLGPNEYACTVRMVCARCICILSSHPWFKYRNGLA